MRDCRGSLSQKEGQVRQEFENVCSAWKETGDDWVMKKGIAEFKKCLALRYLISGILLVFALCMLSCGYIGTNGEHYTILHLILRKSRDFLLSNADMNAYQIWQMGFGTWAVLLLPLVLSLGYTGTLAEEEKNGGLKFYMIRESKASLCFSKLVSCMLSGGIILAAGYAVFGFFVWLTFPSPTEYAGEWERLLEMLPKQSLWLGAAQRLGRMFLYGMAVNVFAFGVSMFFRDKYVVLCLPVMISYLYSTFIQKVYYYLLSRQAYDEMELLWRFDLNNIVTGLTASSRIVTWAAVLAIYLVLTFIFMKVINKRGMAGNE